jgi:hypothetical protein
LISRKKINYKARETNYHTALALKIMERSGHVNGKSGNEKAGPQKPHGTEEGIAYHRDKNEVPPVPELQGKF